MKMRQVFRASSLARHTHTVAYAALVLSGGYEEAGDQGRFRVRAGDVVFHDPFEAHLNRFSPAGAAMLNLRLPPGLHWAPAPGLGRIADPDRVARLAEQDCREALGFLVAGATRWTPQPRDWPDELAWALIDDPSVALSAWGGDRGLAPWTISRGFARMFGVTPEAFRARARARRALAAIRGTACSLAGVAANLGFADQSHMTRSVTALTGVPPRVWRSANTFKTGERHGD